MYTANLNCNTYRKRQKKGGTELEDKKVKKVQVVKIFSDEALEETERRFRSKDALEVISFAKNTSFPEIVKKVVPDKDGPWKNEVRMYITRHKAIIGAKQLCAKSLEYLTTKYVDVLSMTASMDGEQLVMKVLMRIYKNKYPDFTGLFHLFGEDGSEEDDVISGHLIIPEEIKNFKITKAQRIKHDNAIREQDLILENSSKEAPFLNQIKKYEPKNIPRPDEKIPLIYDLRTRDMKTETITPYEEFIKVFEACMVHANGISLNDYISVMKGTLEKDFFMKQMEVYIKRDFIARNILQEEDLPVLLAKIDRALFQLYIVQDLIDDPNVTDVKITAPDSIRARVQGKAYLSNITFVDENDYLRFIQGVAIKNGISLSEPQQTFTDYSDENYILRFSIISNYVSSTQCPTIHIRKVARKKLMSEDLIRLGVMDEKIRDYLIDCGRNSRGIVFAGPPGSGKTVMLNWFLEDAYEQSAEILVIQENDELFAYRKGVIFEHVVTNPKRDQKACDLEDLGQLALVAGANVFVIGEAKGGEICSAITLSNSGCRTAITLHSLSSTEIPNKMADLAMRGRVNYSFERAKRMVQSFQTLVYLEDFKVKEISEIVGYDEKKQDLIFRYIYRRDEED